MLSTIPEILEKQLNYKKTLLYHNSQMKINHTTSKLINRVYLESSPQKSNSENFYAILEGFIKHVLPQLSQINLLFPEYTPHDYIHMESLLKLADDLLGDNGVKNLNGYEACILACSIFGHDWGMAVSDDEKEYILTGILPKSKCENDFALLGDEEKSWLLFSKENRIDTAENGNVLLKETDSKKRLKELEEKISLDIWREYIRKTHAERAKVRCIHFFYKRENKKLGEIIGTVCAGHWYDISKINELSTREIIDSNKINLRALTTYMRFVDLLDISRNRTPYSLWKFINPRNSYSATEWKKHEVIDLYCDRDSRDLEIVVKGKTIDQKVYTSLIDMETWFRKQVEENEATLLELGKYSLGRIKLEWKIEPDGFEPIDLKFKFDRNKMFSLLSDEIYNGDPYVFIRELLQNAIDATKTKELIYKQEGLDINFENKLIKIEAKHTDNGNIGIIFQDNGTGMNLNIVKNYLATVGKSFYRSDLFSQYNLNMNPISRYGVGLLSCFEVSNSLGIETVSDDKVFEKKEMLTIEIENYKNQFLVKKDTSPIKSSGTKIIINIIGEKWQKGEYSEIAKLSITDYIKEIAGFVNYPIYINEDYKETLILNPFENVNNKNYIITKFPNALLWQLPIYLDSKDIFLSNDLANAEIIYNREVYGFKSKEIKGHLISGGISYFFPKDLILGSTRNVEGSRNGVTTIVYNNQELKNVPIRWKNDDDVNTKYESKSPSSKQSPYRKLFINGILIPEIPNGFSFKGNYLPSSSLYINIETNGDSDFIPSLSRKELKNNDNKLEQFLEPLFKEEFLKIYDKHKHHLISGNQIEKFEWIARLKQYLPYSKIFEEVLPIEEWLFPKISKVGKLDFSLVQNLPNQIETLPERYFQEQNNKNGRILTKKSFHIPTYLSQLFQDISFFYKEDDLYVYDFGFLYDDGSSMEWNTINGILKHSIIGDSFNKTSLRIVEINGSRYIIYKWTKIDYKNPPTIFNIQDLYFPSFLTFDNDKETLLLLPLKTSNLAKNEVRDMIYNTNHSVVEILIKALKVYTDRNYLNDNQLIENIELEYNKHPLIGKLFHDYTGNYLQTEIPKWIRNYCIFLQKIGQLSLSQIEINCLNNVMKVDLCFE